MRITHYLLTDHLFDHLQKIKVNNMKSTNNRRKIYVFFSIFLFLLFNTIVISNGLARTIQNNAVFNLDKADDLGPEGYGAIIPSPNTLGAVTLDGSNQGKFTVTTWQGGFLAEEIVSFPGEDISLYYPTNLDTYWTGAMSSTGEIDPWSDLHWLNVSAYNAEADVLSPFTVSTVFDYFAMEEGSVFTQPFNYDHPMQIDLIVKSTGPKVLKFDWLTDNPSAVAYMNFLNAPSGKQVDYYEEEANFQGGPTLYNYLIFTANEIGAYRLLVAAQYVNPASLNLEFLDIKISSLPSNTIKFGGNFDDFATLDVSKTAMWQSQWFKISGTKGELFRLDIYEDFSTGFTPTIDIWTPSVNGYFVQTVGTGRHDIYFAKSGFAYVSLTDVDFEDWYRYSLFLTKANNEKYTPGDTTTFSISMDEIKTVQFTLQQDSIVRFNYTSLPNPTGAPALNSLGSSNAFIFRDSKEFAGFDINSALLVRTVDSTDLYWYYMPKGTYRGVIENANPLANGLFQISSQVYPCSMETIPVNSLTYPMTYPTDFASVDFQSDSEFGSLKDPVGINIEIPDIGQFRLNTTMWLSKNTGPSATISPTYLYTFNGTDSEYYSFGYPQPVFSLDGDSTATDFFYIGAPSIWTGMTLNFSTLGAGGLMECEIYDGSWSVLSEDNDGTSELTTDGTIEFNLGDADFSQWVRGTGGLDIDPSIDENDYFWMRLDCTNDYVTIPELQLLTLLNTTVIGDLQYFLIGESGSEFGDYWGPSGITQPSDPTNLVVSLDDYYSEYDSRVSSIISGNDPMTIGFEGGIYKLLIIPEEWTHPGALNIDFAVENYWDYRHVEAYDISTLSPTPNLHAIDITNYTLAGYSNITGSIYDYGLTTSYNHTESILPYGGESYFALECTGEPYQWTQLVLTFQGVTADFEIYLLQDLPWIDGTGPNDENQLLASTVNTNRTIEFGVFSDQFILLFEVISAAENISFHLSLSQYDTVQLTTSNLRASYTPPIDPALVLALAIIIPSVAGAAIVVYVLKRKGKILTKRPG
jgi:hypothetical protein